MSGTRELPPISSHPAFPGAVALWFAALLGLGTFVMPASIFGNLVSASGLDGIIPAFRPPLGASAKLVISLIAALVGAGIGMVVAARIARAQAGKLVAALEEQAETEFEPLFGNSQDDDVSEAVALEESPEPEQETEASEAEPRPRSSWRARLTERNASETGEAEETAADRLVASLPRLQPEDTEATEFAAQEGEPAEIELVHEEQADIEPAQVSPDHEPVEIEAPVPDAEPAENQPAQSVSGGDEPESDPSGKDGAQAPHTEFTQVSLMNLVARLERAIAEYEPEPARPVDESVLDDPLAMGEGDEADENSNPVAIASKDDPVIAFLRREVDRDRMGGETTPPVEGEGASGDAQANLRKALDRLTQVNSNS